MTLSELTTRLHKHSLTCTLRLEPNYYRCTLFGTTSDFSCTSKISIEEAIEATFQELGFHTHGDLS